MGPGPRRDRQGVRRIGKVDPSRMGRLRRVAVVSSAKPRLIQASRSFVRETTSGWTLAAEPTQDGSIRRERHEGAELAVAEIQPEPRDDADEDGHEEHAVVGVDVGRHRAAEVGEHE